MKTILGLGFAIAIGLAFMLLRPGVSAPAVSTTRNIGSESTSPHSLLPQKIEQGKFRLHKYQALVGEENYEVVRDGDSQPQIRL